MDTFSNCISNLRNAGLVGVRFTKVPNTKLVRQFLKLLLDEGFISGFSAINFKSISVHISYIRNDVNDLSLVSSLKRISIPSRRRHVSCKHLIKYYSGTFVIVSTNKGFMTGTDAIKARLGGELVLQRYYF